MVWIVERTNEKGHTKLLRGLTYGKRKNAQKLVERLNTLRNGRTYRVVRRGR